MRFAPVFLAFFLLLSPALALADSNSGAAESASLPSLPQGQGPIAVTAVLANGTAPAGMPVSITASGSANATYRLITGREGSLLLQLASGEYQLDSVLDDMATPGPDFASTAQLSVPAQGNLTLVFYPAGSVAASVLEGGSPVPGADIRVSCPSDWFDYAALDGAKGARFDDSGGFLFRALPIGTCVISASTQTSAGSSQVQVEQGKIANVQVSLSPKALVLPDIAQLAVAAVVAAALLYLLFAGKKRTHAPEGGQATGMQGQKAPRKMKASTRAKSGHSTMPLSGAGSAKAKAPAASPRQALLFDANGEKARAVLSTLSEREAGIVRLLMASGGKSKRSTMQHKLLIPKTSLLRNLRSLERKNIVRLEPFGRNLVAELQRGLFE